MDEIIPTSRAYIHRRCGCVTIVDGDDFERVAAPFPGVTRTICVTCGRAFSVAEFRWKDTGEFLHEYYVRHREKAPFLASIFCKRWFFLTLLVVNLAVGLAIGICAFIFLPAAFKVVCTLPPILLFCTLPSVFKFVQKIACPPSAFGVSDMRMLK